MTQPPRKLALASRRIAAWLSSASINDADVLALMNEIRMALAASGLHLNYPNLRSYCDLLFHEGIDRKLHWHRLIAASDILRELDQLGSEGADLSVLYEPVFASWTTVGELCGLLDKYGFVAEADIVQKNAAQLMTSLFRCLDGHIISCESEVTTDGKLDEAKAEKVFRAKSTFVTQIEFDGTPYEGEVAAVLKVETMRPGKPGYIKIHVPVNLRNDAPK